MTASAPPAAVLRLLYADGAPCGAEYSGGRLLWGAPYPPPWTVARRDIAWRLWPPGFLAPVRGPLAPQAVPPDDWAAARYGLDAVDAPITGLAALLAARDADALRSVVNRTPLGALRVPEFRAAAAADGMPLHEDLVAALETRELVASALRWTRRTEVAEVLFPAAAHPAEAPRVWVFLTPPPCGGGRALVADARAVDAAVRLSELSPVFLRYNTDSDLWGGALHTLWDALSWAATVVITRRLPPALVSAELAARGIVPGRVVRAFPAPPPGGLLLRLLLLDGAAWQLRDAVVLISLYAAAASGSSRPPPLVVWAEDSDAGRGLATPDAVTPSPPAACPSPAPPPSDALLAALPLRPRSPPAADMPFPFNFARAAATVPAGAMVAWRAALRGDGDELPLRPRSPSHESPPPPPRGPLIRISAGEFAQGLSSDPGVLVVAAGDAGFPTPAAPHGWPLPLPRPAWEQARRPRARARTHGGSRATQRHGVIRRSPALAASDPVPDWRGVYGCVTPPTAVVAAPGSSSSSSGSGGWWHGKRCFKPDERWEGPPVPYLVFMCSERLAPVDMLAWAGVARDAVFVLADYAPRAFDGAVPVPTHLYRLLSAAAASVD